MLFAGRLAWAFLGFIAVAVLLWIAVSRLAFVVVPLLLALFPAAALAPMVHWLTGHRVPRVIAALLAVLSLLIVVGGLIAAVVPAFLAQLPALIDSVTQSLRQLEPLLGRIPGVPEGTTLQGLAQRVMTGLGSGGALGTTVSYTRSTLEVFSGLLLLLVALFFYLYDGPRMASSGIGLLPRQRREPARELGNRLWSTLGNFMRAQSAVAIIDAVLIGVGLVLLGVPLALPLAVLVFIGGFFPYIGAAASGLLAVLVALADGGAWTAVLVLGLVMGVQVLEGNLIAPLVTGHMLRLRAFTVIVSVAIGATLLGVLGAFLAVPTAACLDRMWDFMRERSTNEAGRTAPSAV
ncbi:MAG: AI-2E family transporter [Pseudonocardiaceae bacterium]